MAAAVEVISVLYRWFVLDRGVGRVRAVVPGALDTTYRLARGRDGGWRMVALTTRFAPGSRP